MITELVCTILNSVRVAVFSFPHRQHGGFIYYMYSQLRSTVTQLHRVCSFLRTYTKLHQSLKTFVRSRPSMDINELRDTTSIAVA